MRWAVWTWVAMCGCGLTAADVPKTGTAEEVASPAAPAVAAEHAKPSAEPSAATKPSANQLVVGPFTITPVYHSTVIVEHKDTVFWLDPWSKGALEDQPKADVVLITDIHFDHHDEDAIAKVVKPETVFVAPKAVAAKREAARQSVQRVLANRQSVTVAGVEITAVPMYNLVRGPDQGKLYHEPGRGNGYVLRSGDVRVYFAGDTECTPEMKGLTDIDVAFVPMNLPYTMPPEEAAACVQAFKPTVVVPYHHAGSDLGAFTAALEGTEGVRVRLLDLYPGGLPW